MSLCLRLALLVIPGLALTGGAAETKTTLRVALIIGNAKYEASVGPLRNAVRDAKAMAKTLRGLGFAVIEEHNRSGDCLLLLGRSAEALAAYNTAMRLAPNDSYPIFNRGRAHRALGHTDEAKADFTTAANPRFNQPKARQLALAALAAAE